MRVFTTLVWIFVLLHQQGNCNYADILWGQCYAFCLTRHEARQSRNQGQDVENADEEGQLIGIPADAAIRLCRKNKICKWCLFACDRPKDNYNVLSICLDACKNQRIRHRKDSQKACSDSCRFISKSAEVKYGSCPESSSMKNFRAACVEECSRDIDCDHMEKCCYNGCGDVCHPPTNLDVFPPKPAGLKFKERKDEGMLVEWDDERKNSTTELIVYVLRRLCSDSENVLLSITTKTKVKLKGYPDGILPGARCKFWLSAININGSRGFSPEQSFKKSRLSPSPPLNLEIYHTRVNKGKADVTIRWQPPRDTHGLPVSKYLVLWSDKIPQASANYMRLHMHKQVVPANTLSYTMTDLDPGAKIFVQVKAVVKWGRKSFKGEPFSRYIQVYSVPRPAFEDSDLYYPDRAESSSHVYNITVEKPRFYQSKLGAKVTWSVRPGSRLTKYMLYWTPDVCEGESKHRKTRDRSQEATSHKREFHLYNLLFSCVYELRIHTVDYMGEQDGGRTKYFNTSSCENMQGSASLAVCPHTVPPPAPDELSVLFKLSNCKTCQAVLSWHMPAFDTSSPTRQRIRHFSVLWGQSREPAVVGLNGKATSLSSSTIVYNTEPIRINIPGNNTKACMTYLERSRHYTAQVISHTAELNSTPAVLHFKTPDNVAHCYGMGNNSTDVKDDDSADWTRSADSPGVAPPTTAKILQVMDNHSLPQTSSVLPVFISLLACAFLS